MRVCLGFVLVCLVTLLLCPSASGIGGGLWELNISPSARLNGMGEAGVAVVDGSSFFYNPGSLGLAARELRFAGRAYPSAVEYMKELARMGYSSASAMVGFKPGELSPVAVGFGYHRMSVSDTMSMNGPLITGQTSDEITLGFGDDYGIEIGVGVPMSIVRETVRSYRWTDNALNFRSHMEVRLYDVGISLEYHGIPTGAGGPPVC